VSLTFTRAERDIWLKWDARRKLKAHLKDSLGSLGCCSECPFQQAVKGDKK
jgi:hypothetical protein